MVEATVMPANIVLSLFKLTNMLPTDFRKLKSSVETFWGKKLFASEKSVSQLRKYFVLPIADHWMNGEEQINYWYKNIQSIFILGVSDQFVCGKNFHQDLSSIHLTYSGDHCQRAFRSALKLVVMNRDVKNSKFVYECIASIGHIDCGKDNYQVLQNTYIPKHDKMIDNMQQPEARKCLLGEEVNAEDKILISYLLGMNQRMKFIRNSKLDAVCPAIIIFTRRSKESRIDQDRGVLIVI